MPASLPERTIWSFVLFLNINIPRRFAYHGLDLLGLVLLGLVLLGLVLLGLVLVGLIGQFPDALPPREEAPDIQ